MEDTKTLEQTENMALIEQMLRDVTKAEEPGVLTGDRVVHKGDDEVPAPMVGTVESAGYGWMYDTKTGAASKCNLNMLPRKLKVKRADGSPVFTVYKPKFEPKQGTMLCMLHKDAPNRKEYDGLGLPVCPKGTLLSDFHVKRHMQKRHKLEWAAIEDTRVEKERQEELAERREQREFQKRILGRTVPQEAKKKKK